MKASVIKKYIIIFICIAICVAALLLTYNSYNYLPFEYKETVEQNAEINNLDPCLVFAVIYCESRFDPSAESHVGARGLMQLMPKTAEWIAEKKNIELSSIDELFIPETNINLGCCYLNYLFYRFDSNLINTLAAYNAGEGNVRKWLSDERYSDNGVLTDIPFKETKEYVEKVKNTYEKYKTIYEK